MIPSGLGNLMCTHCGMPLEDMRALREHLEQALALATQLMNDAWNHAVSQCEPCGLNDPESCECDSCERHRALMDLIAQVEGETP